MGKNVTDEEEFYGRCRCLKRKSTRLLRGFLFPYERADETGAGAYGDGVDLGQVDVGRGEGGVEGGQEGLQVGPGGDLGDDAAEAGVLVHGGGDDVAEQLIIF